MLIGVNELGTQSRVSVYIIYDLIHAGILHACFSFLHAPEFACTRIHARQSIIVTGNDASYSPPSSVLHAGLYG